MGEVDEVEAALAELGIDNRKCAARTAPAWCKASVVTIGSNCKHCRLRFCLKHCQPEAHGCGAAAKTQARADNRATLTAPKGALLLNGAPSFPLPPPRPEGRGEAVTLAGLQEGGATPHMGSGSCLGCLLPRLPCEP